MIWYEGATLNTPRSLQVDTQGSIVSVADASGSAVNIDTYDEYGIPGATNIGRFQYTGQMWLPELGMYYYKARIYSPTLGRFLQTDPIGYADQVNLYAYVGNDPMNRRDPNGQDAVLIINLDGIRTLVIPVNYTGSGAHPAAIAATVNSITIEGSTDRVRVVPTTTPIQGVLNNMDVSPGYDYHTYPTAGEGQMPGPGVQGTGGHQAHINSDNGQADQAAGHDTLHFSGMTDNTRKAQEMLPATGRPRPRLDTTPLIS